MNFCVFIKKFIKEFKRAWVESERMYQDSVDRLQLESNKYANEKASYSKHRRKKDGKNNTN